MTLEKHKNWRFLKKCLHFQFDLTFDSHHTKGEPWNYLMKASAPTYRQVPKNDRILRSVNNLILMEHYWSKGKKGR